MIHGDPTFAGHGGEYEHASLLMEDLMAPRSIVEHFVANARSFADHTIVKYRQQRGGPLVDVTWAELEETAISFGLGLMSLGLQPGDRVAILSYNRIEWIVCDMGAMLARGVDVPIYHSNTAQQAAYIVQDSGARFVIVEDAVQLAKVIETIDGLPSVEKVILIEGTAPTGDPRVITYEAVLGMGQGSDSHARDDLAARARSISLDDLATIVYTSGTTGPPKGCMISHGNIARVLESIHEIIRLEPQEHLSLMILPLSHLYPRVSGYYYNISMNVPFAIAESLDTIGQDMLDARPTYFTSVPRIFEKVYARISSTAEKGSPIKRGLFRWAVGVGRRRSRALNAHEPVPMGVALQFGVADRLVFRKIRDALGGRLQFAVSAGAPLSAEVGEFIHSIGVQVLEFYALTETISGSMTTFEQCRYGTVGKPMPGCEITLAEDGEVLIRGNNYLGYWNRPDLTAQTVRDGWCYTGDVGRWDDKGFLVITDRKKDLIITSGGKNISPQNIENLLKRVPLVSIPMVYGDKRNFLTALITLDRAETEAYARDTGIRYATYEELTQSPEIREYIRNGIDSVNQSLARYETIKDFVILPREFSQEEGEITPTLKLKRRPIRDKYAALLDGLYSQQR